MIVYIRRKHRRALQEAMRVSWGAADVPRGSKATVTAAISYIFGYLEEGVGAIPSDECIKRCGCLHCDVGYARLELADAERYTLILRQALPTRLPLAYRLRHWRKLRSRAVAPHGLLISL